VVVAGVSNDEGSRLGMCKGHAQTRLCTDQRLREEEGVELAQRKGHA
jgi:hypothetical protein